MDEGDYRKAMDAALRLLSYRPRTAKEIEMRLKKKGIGMDTITRVRKRLEEIGYIDDARFAASWIRARDGNKCRSGWLLKKELREKGIAEDIAEEAIKANYHPEEIFSAASELVRKKLRGAKDIEKLKPRLQNMLLRRGFDYEFIREVLGAALEG